MTEVSIRINGVRYDAKLLENVPITSICKYCDLHNEKGTSECLKIFKACPLFNHYVFKKSTKQLNFENEGVKIVNVVLKRYTSSKGKSLKWYEWIMNPNTRENERVLRYSECTAVIDTNQLDGEVMEIPYEEYKEWWDNNYHCLGITGL